MDYMQLAQHLSTKYSSKLSIQIMKDLCKSSIKELITNINNLDYLKQLNNSLRNDLSDTRTKYIKKLLNSKIHKLSIS
jgi:RNase P subunit RPR2